MVGVILKLLLIYQFSLLEDGMCCRDSQEVSLHLWYSFLCSSILHISCGLVGKSRSLVRLRFGVLVSGFYESSNVWSLSLLEGWQLLIAY